MRRKKSKRNPGGIKQAGALVFSSLSPLQQRMIILADLASRWESAAGKTLAKRTRPVSFEDGILVVTAETPAFAQEIRMRGASLAKRITRDWGLDVNGVEARVGRVPAQKGNARSSGSRVHPKLRPGPEMVEEARKRVARSMEQSETAEALARLMALYKTRFRETGTNGRERESRG